MTERKERYSMNFSGQVRTVALIMMENPANPDSLIYTIYRSVPIEVLRKPKVAVKSKTDVAPLFERIADYCKLSPDCIIEADWSPDTVLVDGKETDEVI